MNNTMPNLTLNELLDSLGFDKWKTITASYILFSFNIMGVAFSSFSLCIFSRHQFRRESVFFYYRLLSLVFLFHSIHNLPLVICYSPRYFQSITRLNTLRSSMYLIVNNLVSNFLFHYEEMLQIAILLTRMKIFSPFVRKHFKSSPQLISFIFFLVSCIINFPTLFSQEIVSLDQFYYIDTKNETKHFATFYYYGNSKFSRTPLGQLTSLVGSLLLNFMFSLFAGLILNIISFVQYKLYLLKRQQPPAPSAAVPSRHKSLDDENPTSKTINVYLRQKETNERAAEKNMFYMILTLCSVCVLTRLFIMFAFVLFFFYNTFANTLSMSLFCCFVYTFSATYSIVIFYLFNKKFRQTLKRMLACNLNNSNETSSSQQRCEERPLRSYELPISNRSGLLTPEATN